MELLIKGGLCYIDGRLEPWDIHIKNGRIEAVGQDLQADCMSLDAAGKIISPGLCDLHVHLREPGFSYKETIATGTMAAARGGFTTVCAMPNLNPVPDTAEHLAAQLELIRKDAKIQVLPYGSITMGEKGEHLSRIEELASDCCGFSDDGKGVQQETIMRQAMKAIRATGRFLAAHCEDDALLEMHDHHLINTPASEYMQIRRDLILVAETGCPYHVCHISTREGIEAVRGAKAAGLPVTCEVTPHNLALCEEDIEDDGRFKMNPPLRSALDRQAILEALSDGTIDCIATDHAPHSAAEKAGGFVQSINGVVGLETAFAVCHTYLVKNGILTLEQLLALMCEHPRRRLGQSLSLQAGSPADLVVLDPHHVHKIDPDTFFSLGKSTPFSGHTLTGDVAMTIYSGEILYTNPDIYGGIHG